MRKIICLFLAAFIMFAFCACGENKAYNDAMKLYKDGKYSEAMAKFTELGDYKDARKYASRCQGGVVGCQIAFGTEQDLWEVIAVEDNKALLLCSETYAKNPEMKHPSHFGTLPYFDTDWENSKIREWLQGDYYDDIFYTWDKYVVETDHNGVKDTVYCLTAEEAEKYISSDNDRQVIASKEVQKRGTVYLDTNNRVGWWLLPEGDDYYYVSSKGEITKGDGLEWNVAIRPAVWIDLDIYMDYTPGGTSAATPKN